MSELIKPTPEKLDYFKSNLSYIVEDQNSAQNAKIENCIGSVKVPVGIAGPLKIKGSDGTDDMFYAPLATCEATLVASCARGCKLFNAGGGVEFKILRSNMTRAPVFWFTNSEHAAAFYDLVPGLLFEFQSIAHTTSRYARLVRIEPQIFGSTVHILFEYSCGDAAGQNMVTFATEEVCDRFARSETAMSMKLERVTVEGQRTSEKSLSWANILNSRGVAVTAWGVVTPDACQDILGTSTWDLYQGIQNSKDAAIRNGQLGYSLNQANIVTAMFIACGQDAASVSESSWSHLIAEFDRETDNLRLSTYLPSLPMGTVGGGSGLDTQREALGILQCTGAGSKGRLAGLIASFALALDVSTGAAVTNNTFAASHRKFGRSGDITKAKL